MKSKIIFPFLFLIIISLNSFSQSGEDRYNSAVDHMDEGKYEDAILILNELIKTEPDNYIYYTGLGDSYFVLGDLDHALENYERATKINILCTECYINISRIYLERKDTEKADEYIIKAFEQKTEKAEAYYVRALILQQKGRYDEAIMDYTRAILIDRENAEYFIKRAMLYIQNSKLNSAYSDISDAVKLQPENSQYYYYRAFVLMNLNILDEALEDINKAIELNNNVADYYNLKFSIHFSRKEYGIAEASVLRSIEINPNDYNAYINLGDMYFQIGEYEAYCDCYKNAISNTPESLSELRLDLQSRYLKYCNKDQIAYYYIRSLAGFNNNEYDKSIEIVDEGLKYKNNSPVLHNIKASALLAKREYAQAEKEFEKCFELRDSFQEEIINFYNIKISAAEAKAMADSYVIKSDFGIAIANLHRHDFDNSMVHIDKALALAESMGNFGGIEYLYVVKAMIFTGKGDVNSADLEYSKALKKNYDNNTILFDIATLELLSSCAYDLKALRFEYIEELKSPRIILPDLKLKPEGHKRLNEVSLLCDKILSRDKENPYAFLIKAKVAQLLNEQDSCLYAKKAKELGLEDIFEELRINCD